MSSDLFTSLRKYAPHSNNDPIENFITEAFSWILRNNINLGVYLIEEIFERFNNNEKIDFINYDCVTQVNFDGVFPDMMLSTEKLHLIFEHKVWAKLHENQIENYKKFAVDNFDKYAIVLITANKAQHTSKETDINICWSDIYNIIIRWKKENLHIENVIIDSFLNLLKEEGLAGAKPINTSAIMYYNISKNLNSSVQLLIQKIYSQDKARLHSLFGKECAAEFKWGRLGFTIFPEWNPGIFVGFILDEKDHKVLPLAGDSSPDFSIIFDINKKFHISYPQLKSFNKLKKDIAEILKTTIYSWDFYDIFEQEGNQNKWHPIHIRIPMIEMFKNTTEVEEQISNFFNYVEDIVPKILTLDSFTDLKNDLKS